MQLSLKRAESVKNYLVSKGIAENRITVAGYGKTRPLFPNNSAKNRAANRRVEITIIGKTESFPPYNPEEE